MTTKAAISGLLQMLKVIGGFIDHPALSKSIGALQAIHDSDALLVWFDSLFGNEAVLKFAATDSAVIPEPDDDVKFAAAGAMSWVEWLQLIPALIAMIQAFKESNK